MIPETGGAGGGQAVWMGAVTVLGACVGSFLNVVIHRLPRGTFFSAGSRSMCPKCGQPIRWYDNLPVVSWLWLRGRARCCGTRISLRYPTVELLTAGMFLLLFTRSPEGPVLAAPGAEATSVGRFALQAIFVSLLIACAFIDLDHRILPDRLTKPGMVLGCAGAVAVPGLAGGFGNSGLSPEMDSLLFSLLGLAAGLGLTWLVRVGARFVFKKEAMGLGDVKFMGMIGAFLGWQGALVTFLLGCLVGAVGGVLHRWVTGDPYVPFGPFLAIGAGVALFTQQSLMTFLFTTWPEWTVASRNAPWVLAVTFVVCVAMLVVLVRRGRAS